MYECRLDTFTEFNRGQRVATFQVKMPRLAMFAMKGEPGVTITEMRPRAGDFAAPAGSMPAVARDAFAYAHELIESGTTLSQVRDMLTPWFWTMTVVTMTAHRRFFAGYCDDRSPLGDVARMMAVRLAAAETVLPPMGGEHVPFLRQEERRMVSRTGLEHIQEARRNARRAAHARCVTGSWGELSEDIRVGKQLIYDHDVEGLIHHVRHSETGFEVADWPVDFSEDLPMLPSSKYYDDLVAHRYEAEQREAERSGLLVAKKPAAPAEGSA